ncbi:hypothetical protein WPS_00640 [Vulcanimicrobium alpinum]|uniref:YhaN AAA domain-containing protein n=1 Tax=Vulcanimicrobium alpinum TaxID=3016050 RepID=A0AAN1XRS9_UNVUL|nr:AAA family ATPase [Vulcanimicrobium alpinum]BDE04788.1 hypothetical protein WPS_00640 [Vulcanimicrobium alpinum]
MKLLALRIDGFGRLAGHEVTFAPGLNVVSGPNEAGKSTLAAAIIASLYGLQRGEKERWRPWRGEPFAAVLRYETADGARWEVHRAFDRDTKGVRIYDADGNDAAARVGSGRSLVPGDAHLRIPLEVFMQTACVRQRAIALDGDAAGAVSTALAQALDGGPKEDAAIGAIARLDLAVRKHVGTQRAHKNAPLRALRDEEERRRGEAADARAALESLAELRDRIAAARAERDDALAAAAQCERDVRALRAAHLRARSAALREHHDELAGLQQARAAYDDVADFDVERLHALDDAYYSWRSAESVAEAAERDLIAERPQPGELEELEARRADAGTFDDDAFEALRLTGIQADAARAKAAAAASDAAAARRAGDGGGPAAGAVVAAALAAFAVDVGVAIAHWWVWTAVIAAFVAVLGFAAVANARSRARRRRSADALQRLADDALAEEARTAAALARVLEPLRITRVDELARRRVRYLLLAGRETARRKAEVRAATARSAADGEAARFDAIAGALAPDGGGTRDERREHATRRAARRRKRDGLDASLAMLAVRRDDILQGDDEFALQAEYEALVASGVDPAPRDDQLAMRRLERQRTEAEALAHEADLRVHALMGQLQHAERAVRDVAELDEELAAVQARIAELEAFRRAVELARATIETRKDEAHRLFARRLEQYSAEAVGAITGARYGEIRLDPATLAIRVRVPETGAIEDLAHLSAGTTDQIALVVRLATARMFAEGLETPPLLLDDPFAFWDAERIARCLPLLVHAAHDAQIVLFTASDELAREAERAGAHRVDLAARALAAPSG